MKSILSNDVDCEFLTLKELRSRRQYLGKQKSRLQKVLDEEGRNYNLEKAIERLTEEIEECSYYISNYQLAA
jgi:hypothetical protein